MAKVKFMMTTNVRGNVASVGNRHFSANLLRERGGLEASIRAMDEMLTNASDTREKLEQQNSVFVKMKGKLGEIGENW